MKIIVVWGLLCFAMTARCAVPFEEAYRQISDYQTAQVAVGIAQEELTRTTRNPAAPPVDLLLAQQHVTLIERICAQALFAAKRDHLSLYAEVLQARDAVAIAEIGVAQNELAAQVASIRQQAGLLPIQELVKTTDAATRANVDLVAAQQVETLASLKFHTLSNEPVTPLALPPTPDLPKMQISTLPQMVAANFRISDAERAYLLALGPDTAAVDLQARDRDRHIAKDAAQTLSQQLTISLETAKHDYLAAVDMMTYCERSLSSIQKALDMVQTQYKSGVASKMTFLEGQSMVRKAILARDTALMTLWRAYYSLYLASDAISN